MKIKYTDILKQNEVIVPIIQRDYAQGRTDAKSTAIRNKFLVAIFSVIDSNIKSGDGKKLELDFIYGYRNEGPTNTKFYPIDGQQRLTTMWLLHWYVARKEKAANADEFLKNFSYETRHSSNLFIKKLTQFHPEFDHSSIDLEITDQSWYFDSWNYDPSIKSMLLMLKEIEAKYQELKFENVWDLFSHNDTPFVFHLLDMGKVGLPDDLYIKMNSRGKPLTDFEYFKAGFLDIITDRELKKRFENSIDQHWAEFVWDVTQQNTQINQETDLALVADACFLRLINYITDILAYIDGQPFSEINASIEETKAIYSSKENILFLFDTLDALSRQYNKDPSFWNRHFYFDKSDFSVNRVRLFFVNRRNSLVESCLLNYEKSGRGFSLPEQILLYASILQLKNETLNFKRKIRIIRNLVVNSENELRLATIQQGLKEVKDYILKEDIEVFDYFKKDQIQEEKDKQLYLDDNPTIIDSLYKLEDSSILRGCISIFDLDSELDNRAIQFLKIFDDDDISTEFLNRSNLLLCFGDYSQEDGDLVNLLSKKQRDWRTFFTTPGYDKTDLFSKTKIVLLACIDYFIENTKETYNSKIEDALSNYESSFKDWKFYFLKYNGFRCNCNQGYYKWYSDSDYLVYKMKERQFNGYHWDPFLEEIKNQINNPIVELNNYGGNLELTTGGDLIGIKSSASGFQLFNRNEPSVPNKIIDYLIANNVINESLEFKINQDNNIGLDLEDRVERGVFLLNSILREWEQLELLPIDHQVDNLFENL